ncbi:MAG TPA: peptidylprolyl isomerase [Pyrodictium sp.]|nr:peptidylprolyl isomerase [Pyrodictium sp.]HIQ56259.1 peptidylprolyl isomerase [Pyrodictium sp.]
MAFNDGDFVLVEYDLWVKDTGSLIDTTDEEKARKEGIYDPRERYGPRLVIVGEGRLIRGLEEAIKGLDVGKEIEVEIPPEKAFGKRDPNKIKVYPKTEFLKHGIVPEPNKVVEIDGKPAIIRSVTGGRVIVDFNHPLAGRTVKARVKAVKKLELVDEKIKYLVLRRLPPVIGDQDVNVEYDAQSKTAKVMFNEKILNVNDAEIAKRIVVEEIKRYVLEVDRIVFEENIVLRK